MSETQATPKKKKPFYLRWWVIALAVVVAISAFSNLGDGGNATEESQQPTNSETSSPTDSESSAEPTTEVNYFEDEYGTFTSVTFEGTGDDVVTLPAGVTYAVLEATHNGSRNFIVQSLDPANEMAELLVNTIGGYDGVVALGFSVFGDPADKLQIQADGNWAITLSPISSASPLPSSGSGDGVFLYEGTAPVWNLSHDGSRNFIVVEHSSDAFSMGLLVNEIGAYEGTVTGSAGPSVIVIQADGNWTIAQ